MVKQRATVSRLDEELQAAGVYHSLGKPKPHQGKELFVMENRITGS